jgi:hypothetical protein
MTTASTALLLLIFLLTCLLMYREGFMDTNGRLFLSVTLLTAAFAMRILLMDHRTGDYNVFLAPWVEHFRAGGGFRALDDIVGNYNLPYQYFLALFSYIPMAPLYSSRTSPSSLT